MSRNRMTALVAGTAALAAVVAAVVLYERPWERSRLPPEVPAQTRPAAEATASAPVLTAESRPASSQIRSTAFVNRTRGRRSRPGGELRGHSRRAT